MSAEVQHLLDRLADDIGRSVVINDPAVVMLYSSRHFGDEDPVRVEAMLNRVAGSAAIAHVLAQDVGRWTRPGRIPAKPAIGMRARLCVPLRWRGDLLGLLMVIDADDDLPAADRARIDAAAREVAALLVGERAAADAAVAADDALVADLLSLDPAARERAVAALAARLARRQPARAERSGPEPAGDRRRSGCAGRRGHCRSWRCAPSPPTARTPRSRSGTRCSTHAAPASPPWPGRPRPPSGSPATRWRSPSGWSPPRTRWRAGGSRAWRASGRGSRPSRRRGPRTGTPSSPPAPIPHLAPGPVVDAATLGAFGLLLRIPELDPTALPAPVATLLAADSRGVLVRTLEAYLRHAGSAPAAADELHIHRTTLHYRLDRVRSITGCDPDDGETRLLLHLGLGVARLLGLLASEQNGPGSPALGP